MSQYIQKDALVAEIERLISNGQVKLQESQESNDDESYVAWAEHIATCIKVLSFLNTLEVIDPYKECVQYASIKAGIQAHAETYSFNIESELFNQLSKEQQGLWRKEIEQACISGGEVGVELAKDPRYKENVEVKEVDLDALGVLAEHLIACDAHLVTPKYTDNELNLLEELAKNNKAQKL